MEACLLILPWALAIPAKVGHLFLDRTLLLTDKFKFPYPVATTCFQLSITVILAFSLRILLALVTSSLARRPSTSFSAYQHIASPNSADIESFKAETDESRLSTSSGSSRSSSPERRTHTCAPAITSGPTFALIIVLASRLMLGNVLLSRLPFSNYALAQTITPLLALPFSHTQTPAPTILVTVAASLALAFAALPLTVAVSLETIFLTALLPILDTLLFIIMHRTLHSAGWLQQASLASGLRLSERLGIMLHYSFDIVHSTIITISNIGAGSLVFTVLTLFASGEVKNLERNCYVLGDSQFWHRIGGTSALQSGSLLCIFLIATIATPLTMTLLHVVQSSILLPVLLIHSISPQCWINLSLCWVFCLIRVLQSFDETVIQGSKTPRGLWTLTKKGLLALVIYGIIYQGSYAVQDYLRVDKHINVALAQHSSNLAHAEHKHDKAVVYDAFLGKRPGLTTAIDINEVMEQCRNDKEDSGVADIVSCLSFLATSRDTYLLPANDSSPGGSEESQNLAGGLLTPDSEKATTLDPATMPRTRKTKCDGPLFVFHTYWTGPATWRFELFVKAYLITQNLACSRLWIWLDTDIDAEAMNKMLYHDPVFRHLQPLLDDGYIELRRWAIPDRILIPEDHELIKTLVPLASKQAALRGPEVFITDEVLRTANGTYWLVPDKLYKAVSTPTQVSDLVRFLVLHLHGGVYLDLDILLMRDFRPLLLPNKASISENSTMQPAWAEQWVERSLPSDYNTAVLALPAHSQLSTYLLHGGMRMGMNFHPLALGRMLCTDRTNSSLMMWHTALFDPLATNLRRQNTRICTVPCHKNFESAFMRDVDDAADEWSTYTGAHVPVQQDTGTNRTMENFFRGAFAYHIHNQWWKFPEEGSWMDVITRNQDEFFRGDRTNAYGEIWGGPAIDSYDRASWGWQQDDDRLEER